MWLTDLLQGQYLSKQHQQCWWREPAVRVPEEVSSVHRLNLDVGSTAGHAVLGGLARLCTAGHAVLGELARLCRGPAVLDPQHCKRCQCRSRPVNQC